jgi:hypothetical protein
VVFEEHLGGIAELGRRQGTPSRERQRRLKRGRRLQHADDLLLGRGRVARRLARRQTRQQPQRRKVVPVDLRVHDATKFLQKMITECSKTKIRFQPFLVQVCRMRGESMQMHSMSFSPSSSTRMPVLAVMKRAKTGIG